MTLPAKVLYRQMRNWKKQHLPEQCPEHLRTPERPEMTLPTKALYRQMRNWNKEEFLYGTENDRSD